MEEFLSPAYCSNPQKLREIFTALGRVCDRCKIGGFYPTLIWGVPNLLLSYYLPTQISLAYTELAKPYSEILNQPARKPIRFEQVDCMEKQTTKCPLCYGGYPTRWDCLLCDDEGAVSLPLAAAYQLLMADDKFRRGVYVAAWRARKDLGE